MSMAATRLSLSLPAVELDAGRVRSGSARVWARLCVAAAVLGWAASFVVGFRVVLAVLVLLGFVAAVAGLFRPALGLLGVGILCVLDAPMRVFLFTGGIWRWNTFNYWLLISLVLFMPFVLQWRDWHTRTLQLFVLVMGIGLMISPDLMSGIQDVLAVVACFSLMAYFYREHDDPEGVYRLGLVCGVMAAAGGFAFLAQKATLPAANANAIAFLPLTGLFACCLAFPYAVSRSRGHLLLCLLAGINLAAAFLTGSRGSMLMGIACAVYLTLALRGIKSRVIAMVTAGLLGTAVSTQFTDLQAIAVRRLDKLLNRSYSLTARTSGRSDLALGAWYVFRDHPLGVGTGGFATAWAELGDRKGLSGFGRGKEKVAHAGWAKALAENGLPGIGLLLAYVLSFVVVGWRRGGRQARLLGLLTTVVLAAAFISTEFQAKGIWLLASGVTILLHYGRVPEESRV